MLKTRNECSKNYTNCSTSSNTAMYATGENAILGGVVIKHSDIEKNFCFSINTKEETCSFCQKLLNEMSATKICL